MRRMITVTSLLTLLAAAAPASRAGDCVWATMGKVMTGVAAGVAVAGVLKGPGYTAVNISCGRPKVSPPPVLVYSKHGHSHPRGFRYRHCR